MTIDKGKTSSIQTSKSCSNYSAGNYEPAVDARPDDTLSFIRVTALSTRHAKAFLVVDT